MKIILLLAFTLVSCATPKPKISVGILEDRGWYGKDVETTEDKQYKLDLKSYTNLLDVRATGDAAWTLSRKPIYGEEKARKAEFDLAMKQYDPHASIFVADLSFINFETVVGKHCDKIRRAVSFYFLTDPDAITQAIDHGFNLISFSNNHAQDCDLGRAFMQSKKKHGPLMTEESVLTITPNKDFMWNGVGESGKNVSLKQMNVKGKDVTIALGAISLLNWDIPNAKVFDYTQPDVEEQIEWYLKEFSDAQADLKILSIHTQDASGDKKPEAKAFLLLKKIADKFILDHDGDLVFGHGPHAWGGVKYLEKKDKTQGVIFTSTGNFLHEGLASVAQNYVARAIYDFESMRLKQIQVIPFRNNRKVPNPPLANGTEVDPTKIPTTYYSIKQLKKRIDEKVEEGVPANFKWRVGKFTDHETKRKGLYFASFE